LPLRAHFAGYDRRSVAARQGNTIDGVQAGYARIPFARANLAVIPHKLSDEDVLLLDIASTGGPWNGFFPHERDAAQARYRRAKTICEGIANETRAGTD